MSGSLICGSSTRLFPHPAPQGADWTFRCKHRLTTVDARRTKVEFGFRSPRKVENATNASGLPMKSPSHFLRRSHQEPDGSFPTYSSHFAKKRALPEFVAFADGLGYAKRCP